MIKIKEAGKIAAELTDNGKVPKHSGLRDWVSRGLITAAADYIAKGRGGGRVGLYDDSLSIQIAVTAELKESYSLAEIAEIADKIQEDLIEQFSQKSKDRLGKLNAENPGEMELMKDSLLYYYEMTGQLEENELSFDEIKWLVKIEEYKKAWLDFEEKLKAVKVN